MSQVPALALLVLASALSGCVLVEKDDLGDPPASTRGVPTASTFTWTPPPLTFLNTSTTTSTASAPPRGPVPDPESCHTHLGRDVRSTAGHAEATVRPESAASLRAGPDDRLKVFLALDPGGFAILVEPRWMEAQAWIALGEPETDNNAGWQQPERREVDASTFLGLVRDAHCAAVADALAETLPADLRVHLRVLRPGASYDTMRLDWDDDVPADGTWLLVKTVDVVVVETVLGGVTVDRAWEAESSWDLRAGGSAYRWDFMTVGGGAGCFDDATGAGHFGRCGGRVTGPLQAFSDVGAARLVSAYDALAAGEVPMAACRGAPCVRWADAVQDLRIETTSSTATLSWKDVEGLPTDLWVTFLDSDSPIHDGKLSCLCWSDPVKQDGRWASTLRGLAGDAVFGFDLVHGNPATAIHSGTLRTQPAALGLGPVRIVGSATSVWFDLEATGSGPLLAAGHWASSATGVTGQTNPSPSPQGRLQFGVWLTEEDVLPPGTYEAYVVLADDRGGRIESARQSFVVA